MFKAKIAALTLSTLMVCGGVAGAQQNRDFYNGIRDGGRGGQYDSYDQRRNSNGRYNNGQPYYNNGQPYNNGGRYNNNDGRYNNNDPRYNHGDPNYNREGGVGPGKGALIGGAGGALLGALFGGGLKGSLIGGAAGAGIGAVVGKAHQDNTRRNRGYYQR
jgi:hypothetical protein